MQMKAGWTRRGMLRAGAACVGAAALRRMYGAGSAVRVFDVAKYGAVGDGRTLDSPAIQRAIDEAAAYAGKAQVLLRGGKRYLVGTLQLKGAIDFHLADDAQLLASLRGEDYLGNLAGSIDADRMASAAGAMIVATGAQGLTRSTSGGCRKSSDRRCLC
jgi:polygalacturonase